MKCYWVLILFWISLLGGVYMAQPGTERHVNDQERVDILTSDGPEILATLICANNVADVSLQQNTSVNINSLLRRHPQSRPIWDRLFIFPEDEAHLITSRYRAAYEDYGNYFAVQKQSGYYLYSLCRLII